MKLLQMPTPAWIKVRASEMMGDENSRPSEESAAKEERKEVGYGLTDLEENPWAVFRNHTVVLLRKYFKMSLEVGRMPSLLGGELFRAKVTVYQVHTFEDSVIFVHDMEQSLERLDPLSRLLIARTIFEEFSHDEVAAELRITRRQVIRRLFDALDRMSAILVEREVMDPFCETTGEARKKPPAGEKEIMEAKILEFPAAESS